MSPERRPLGPVMLDVEGCALDATDREILRHPAVGGLILFARNFRDPETLRSLTREVAALRDPALIIAVDHEGGRVQRFREGFTVLPPMADLGVMWDRDPSAARAEAQCLGRLIGEELGATGIDFSFTPVLDLAHGHSEVIGNRAFHRQPVAVAELAGALVKGLSEAGMAAVGKHFPGHGFVTADSHHALPIDERDFATIAADDLLPFAALVRQGIAGMMPAHCIYSACDAEPAGYSGFWLREVLRQRLGFQGLIFSDDLAMVGAHAAGDIVARASQALGAGCDMVLVCNSRPQAIELLERGRLSVGDAFAARAEAMRRRPR